MKDDTSSPCIWSQDESGYYDTLCGSIFAFTDGTPEENNFHFCPYCGKKIISKENDDE